jgi:hypothetical protein
MCCPLAKVRTRLGLSLFLPLHCQCQVWHFIFHISGLEGCAFEVVIVWEQCSTDVKNNNDQATHWRKVCTSFYSPVLTLQRRPQPQKPMVWRAGDELVLITLCEVLWGGVWMCWALPHFCSFSGCLHFRAFHSSHFSIHFDHSSAKQPKMSQKWLLWTTLLNEKEKSSSNVFENEPRMALLCWTTLLCLTSGCRCSRGISLG